MNKILLIGSGHMGSALVAAWIKEKKYKITIVDPKQHKIIHKRFKGKITAFKNITNINQSILFDHIIFAVKPQVSEKVLSDFKIHNLKFKKSTIFISVIAGKNINFFKKYLPINNQFIRVMPNIPALINEGVSCLVSNKFVSNYNKKKVETLFSRVGLTFWLKKENDMNIVTAISGSGPGYVFLFVDAFEKAAKAIGLKEKFTKELIYQTFFGSIKLLLNQNQSAEILASNVAIKGGTTEAAIKVFKKNKIFHKLIEKAIKAAHLKSQYLGK